MKSLLKAMLLGEAILFVWLTRGVAIVLIGSLLAVRGMVASEAEAVKKSDGWVRSGLAFRAEEERYKARRARVLRFSSICVALGSGLISAYMLWITPVWGSLVGEGFWLFVVVLPLLIWLNTGLGIVQQSGLNSRMSELLRDCGLRDEPGSASSQVDRERYRVSAWERPFIPSERLVDGIKTALRQMEILERTEKAMTKEQKKRFELIKAKENRFLAARVVRQKCRHWNSIASLDSSFITIDHRLQGATARYLRLCKYDLAADWYDQHLNVIVHPPV